MHAVGAPTYSVSYTNDTECMVTLDFTIPSNAVIYHEHLALSVDHPDVTITSWHTDSEPVELYDETFKETKLVFNKNFTITAQIKSARATLPEDAQLHCAYYMSDQKRINEDLFALAAPTFDPPATPSLELAHHDIQTHSDLSVQPEEKSISFSERISSLVETTDSLWMRLLLVMLLGLLMSLTPCIYPMIPITVGILQGHAKKSFMHNFLVALSYTVGIATTFALLGLAAAFTGQMFGTIMNNPFVIIGIVCLLAYLALCMFDVFQMPTPKGLSGTSLGSTQSGSCLYAFLFGAASGTVASPCLSPGLIMLLSLVTSLGSPYLGFLLLFFFGIGLSIPLLLIGTFSSSLTMLPQAGMWMIEIKHFFGLLLFAMCFYFLKNIMPWAILSWLIVLFVAGSGLYYLHSARSTASSMARMLKNILGIALLALSVHLSFKAYQSVTTPIEPEQTFWEHDYPIALARAKQEGKKLFVDIGAPFCSICHALDNTLFKDSDVVETLHECVALKVDGSEADHPLCCNKEYNVIGFPTILVIDPQSGSVIKRWGAELYDTKKEAFIDELNVCLVNR